MRQLVIAFFLLLLYANCYAQLVNNNLLISKVPDGTDSLQTFVDGINTSSYFNIVNPGSPYPAITASTHTFVVSSTSGQGTSSTPTTNRLQTQFALTSGVVSADFYAASLPISTSLHFYVDNSNRVSIAPVSSTGLARLFIVVGGVVVYTYAPGTVNAYRTRWKIVIDSSNNISAWYWNLSTFQWTQFGVTQNYNIGTNKFGAVSVQNVNTETGTARFDNFSFTQNDYSTRYPTANYVYADPEGLQDLMFNGFYNMIGNYQDEPSGLTIDSLTYIPVTTQGTSNLNYFLLVYNHDLAKVGDLIRCNDANFSYNSTDVHNVPVAWQGGSKLYFSMSPRGGTNDLKALYGSSTSFTNLYNWSSTWTVRNTDTGSRFSEYFHYKTLSTNRIISLERGKTASGDRRYVDLMYSDDSGVTWTRYNFIDLGAGAAALNEALYPLVYYDNTDKIRVFFNLVKVYTTGTDERMPDLYYMESEDGGITWSNVNNTYSKNTTLSGVINATDLTNYLVYSVSNIAGTLIRANASQLINGYPACVAGIDNNNTLGLVYWDGSVWQRKTITCTGHTIAPSADLVNAKFSNSSLVYYDGTTITLYTQEIVSTYVQTSKFISTDLGDTWTFVEQLTSGNFDHPTIKVSRKPDGTFGSMLLILRKIDADSGTFYLLQKAQH